MVSFQCNRCGDVFTKPKLDKHRAICCASFDCIDCGTRFETPANYKGHTSCISEADKYQKGLSNGGSGPERNGRNQRSWQQGGGRQRGDNRQRWQQRNVNQATGANGTPLGTPARMSPVNDTPVVQEDSNKMQPASTPGTTKRQAEAETTELKDTPKPTKKRRKEQKTVEDTQETAGVMVVEVESRSKGRSTPEVAIPKKQPHNTDFRSAEVENTNTAQEAGEKKQRKQKKKGEPEAKEVRDEKGVKKVKREKKQRKGEEDPSPSGKELGSAAMSDTKATVAAQPPMAEVLSTLNPERARPAKKSKSESKSELKTVTTGETPDVTASTKSQSTAAEVTGVARNYSEGNRKKKGHTGNHHEDSGDAKRVTQGNSETPKERRKEKKKKRKWEGQTVTVVE